MSSCTSFARSIGNKINDEVLLVPLRFASSVKRVSLTRLAVKQDLTLYCSNETIQGTLCSVDRHEHNDSNRTTSKDLR